MIKITCKSHTTVPIADLKWFQGKLAETTKDRLKKLKHSIEKHGIFMAFSVWDDGKQLNIVDGHARKAALEELGYDGSVPINFVIASSYEDAKEKVLLARSQTNTTTEEGLYEFAHDLDWEELSKELDLPGIDVDEFIDGYITEKKDEEADVEDLIDRAEELNKKWQVQPGDLWQLGRHRLLCGDSTKREDVERLMDGQKADMVFTDPPYGVDYDGGTTIRPKLKGDNTTDLYVPCCQIAMNYSVKDAPLYLWHAGVKGIAAAAAVAAAAAGYMIRCEIVWNKNQTQYGALSAQYKQKHEPCYYCYKKGSTARWCGSTRETTVWDIDRSSRNDFHPTQKPPELAEKAIGNHSVGLILDLFLGGAGTLIACEKMNRTCFGLELEPKYCAVTLERWSQYTGGTPERVNGTTD